MKLWLTKYRIASALDAGKPLSPGLRQKIDSSPEIRSFFESASALRQKLKSPPRGSDPAALHTSIMRAIKTAARPAEPLRRAPRLAWLPVPLAAGVIAVAIWLSVREPVSAPDNVLEKAAVALHTGQELAQRLPSTVTAPLDQELLQLDTDIAQTTEFLMASVP